MTGFSRNTDFHIGEMCIRPGKKSSGELPVAKLVTGNQISIPLYVFNGMAKGPVLWISAAIHGDEVAGVEIIRRVIANIDPRKLSGTIVAVPIVNVHGFLNKERYLPDRRDLNRSFPGSSKGSLAARIAHLFMKEIVERCDLGIDLHTGSNNRTNLPQIRSNLDNPEIRELCEIFGAPIMVHSKLRDGSLREAASDKGKKILLYEGGEANRFEENAIQCAVRGIMNIIVSQNMMDYPPAESNSQSLISRSSFWLRAKKSGILITDSDLGDSVKKGQILGIVHDSLGKRLGRVITHLDGIIIGKITQPLVNQGDAVFHIAEVEKE